MVTDESKYIIYFRNGKYHVCKECYRNMLNNDKIIEDRLRYNEAAQIANNLNWYDLVNLNK